MTHIYKKLISRWDSEHEHEFTFAKNDKN